MKNMSLPSSSAPVLSKWNKNRTTMKFAYFIVALVVLPHQPLNAYNGDLAEFECPDECDCHFFRVNWVTDCSESNLTEIPYNEISPNVYILDLNGNFISDVEGQAFPPEIKLRRLQLANNLMSEVRAASFVELNYIIDADFANNQIRRIEPSTFENKAGFLTLELQDNPLDRIEGPFLYSNTLLYLDISNCNLDYLSPHFFANVSALSTLDLSNNPLGQLDDARVFQPLRTLGTLRINHCNLTFIGGAVFHQQTNLKLLELSGNKFANVEWSDVFKSMARLEYVDLRRSALSGRDIPSRTFDKTIYLRTLILAENDLDDFDVSSTIGAKLHHLEILDLSYCNLSKTLSTDAFANATKLKTLYLSGNRLLGADLLLALEPLHKMQKLTLSDTGLRVLPNTLHKFKSLIELDISNNPLNDVFVQLLAPLETLEYLNMGYSNLSYISPSTFTKMTSMKRLVLSGNDLNSLEAGMFANLTHLESLELNSCGLRRALNATVFFNHLTYTDLTELQLAGNPLKVSPTGPLLPKQLSRLQTLDLSHCNLTFLPADAFINTPKITHLLLTGNQFKSVNELNFLLLLPQLEVLDLRYNNLTTFEPTANSLQTLTNSDGDIVKLKLVGNPWRCDCWVAELWNWAIGTRGNLNILEGATIDDGDITAGKTKRKRLLQCHYKEQHERTSGRRSAVAESTKKSRLTMPTNRTWAKYVRESKCEEIRLPSRMKRNIAGADRVENERTVEEKLLAQANHEANTWGHNLVYVTICYGFGLLVVLVIYLLLIRSKRTREQQQKDN